MEEDTENTTDSETGLTVSDAMEQAEEEGIDLYAMEAGETVTFMAKTSARSVQKVSVTRGTLYRYADYGYGSYPVSYTHLDVYKRQVYVHQFPILAEPFLWIRTMVRKKGGCISRPERRSDEKS